MSLVEDLHSFLRSRRSVRRFRAAQIATDVIERILTTATFAPSAHNRQPWRFVVLSSTVCKSDMAESMAIEYRRDLLKSGVAADEVETLMEKSRSKIREAPLAIVLCMDRSEMDVYPDARRNDAERTMAIQSTANAGLMLLLACQAEGLASVWNCSPLFAQGAVVSALDLPRSWEPQALMLIGEPAAIPESRPRKAVAALSIFR